MDPVNTVVTALQPTGKNPVGNIRLEHARFFGRPNFSGAENRFKDARRQFTVIIPNEVADQLREIGYNVKTKPPTDEERAQGREDISFLKVMVDIYPDEEGGGERGSKIFMKVGDSITKLSSKTAGALDRSRIDDMIMEIRAWNYNKDEVDQGLEQPKYSARLVEILAEVTPSFVEERYGNLAGVPEA